MLASLFPLLMFVCGVSSTSNINITSDIRCGNIQTLTPQDRVQGWIEQPNFRGTWEILWTCLVTIFIATYTILCLNVPAPNESYCSIFSTRIFWMCLAIIAPEIVLTYAAGQWSRAKQSVQAFKESGHEKWTMRMAFFADMGGFLLCPKESESFPLNAKQLHWLVEHKKIEYPEVTAEEMWDKSKQDRLAKVIACIQIGYLIIHCIGRAVQQLAITTLELNAMGIVVLSLMTSYTWLHKPSDVRTPIRLYTNYTSEELAQSKPWRLTPLDHIDANMPGWSTNVQTFMKAPVIPEHRPIRYLPNDRFPTNPYGAQEYLLCLATIIFAAIHVAGWNFSFPSYTEQLLWRICSMILFGVTAAFWILETVASWVRLGRWRWLYYRLFDRGKLHIYMEAVKATIEGPARDLATLPVPWEFWTITPIALLYGLARLYLIVEAFLELRNMEATAFVNVDWARYIPHI